MFLITATLTTLRTKLLTDCDRTLAYSIQQPPPPYPKDELKSIVQDLRKMADMVDINKFQHSFITLNDMIQNQTTVREIINLMKQIVHQAVSQYYKVYEKSMVIPCKGYKLEGKNKFETIPQRKEKDCEHVEGKAPTTTSSLSTTDLLEGLISPLDKKQYNTSIVEHMDQQAHWFRTYFIHQAYETFCGYDEENEPVLITAMYDTEQQLYRVITRLKQGPSIYDMIQDSFLLNAPLPQHHNHHSHHHHHQSQTSSSSTSSSAILITDDHPQMNSSSLNSETTTTTELTIPDTTWKAVIESSSAIPLLDTPFHRLKKITQDTMESNGLEDDILKLDENGYHTRYKFGILFVKEDQTKEEEWFSNQHDSNDLDHFLNIIGNRISLLGYDGWAAGLDTKTGDSGEFSYVSTWQEHTIAYHVSTLIPSSSGDKQQIRRKKHIGNGKYTYI
ncbi:hypothetical protein BJ944DRAFT_234730 [Cunninghamella echinulata]|nr:hypothetical protein BJ944DRAFT_234730 [Cunninghamella echinulata]